MRILSYVMVLALVPAFGFGGSSTPAVCQWTASVKRDCKDPLKPFCPEQTSTDGYTWGNGPVTTADECFLILRAKLLSWDNYVYRKGDLMTFVERGGAINTCFLSKALRHPRHVPESFTVTMFEAGQEPPTASVKDLYQFEEFITQNLEVSCTRE